MATSGDNDDDHGDKYPGNRHPPHPYLEPVGSPLEEVPPGRGHEPELCGDGTVIVLYERRTNGQVLGFPGGLLGDPLQHPHVTLIMAGDFQCGQEVSTRKEIHVLGTLSKAGQQCAHAHQASARREHGIVREPIQQRHLPGCRGFSREGRGRGVFLLPTFSREQRTKTYETESNDKPFTTCSYPVVGGGRYATIHRPRCRRPFVCLPGEAP